MSKTLSFTVTLTFESEIERDEDVISVAKNITRAIVYESGGFGIAPQEGDTYLEHVSVKPEFLDQEISEKVY